jgi:hypothetical protein
MVSLVRVEVLSTTDPNTLSITLDTFESWDVRAADVKVTCVPKEAEMVKRHFDWLRLVGTSFLL